HHGGDAGGVLQGAAGHLGGIDDAGGDHVAVLLLVGIKAVAGLAGGADLLQDHGAIQTGVGSDLTDGSLQGLGHDADTGLFVALHAGKQSLHGGDHVHEDGAAAGHNAFLNSGAGGVQGVLDAELLLLHLGLGGSADLDDGHAASQLSQPLLQLLLVIVAGGGGDLRADLAHAILDGLAVAGTVHDGGVLLGDLHLAGAAQHIHGGALQLQTDLLGNHGAAGQNGDILQHLLAAVAKAGSLDTHHVQGAAQTVHDQGGQSLALHVLRDDQQLLA
ncbi:AAA+ ATPase domain-containing protein, partial [Dysosmobacter welbionis]